MNSTTPFVKQLLVDLRDTVKDLKKENKELSASLVDASCKVGEQGAEICGLKRLLGEKDAEIVELKET